MYIFLCAEILGIVIWKKWKDLSFSIGDNEFILSQYANGTSLILDGTVETLDASLRTLQHYANMSSLNINLEKTRVVWIGKSNLVKILCV